VEQEGMADYSKRETRRAGILEALRRHRIAEQLGLAVEHYGRALWLFCPYCARRKVTDIAWFAKHIKENETGAEMLGRLPCLGCGRSGSLKLILAPAALHDMPAFFKQWDARNLILSDRD
jgi:hypothetical protein